MYLDKRSLNITISNPRDYFRLREFHILCYYHKYIYIHYLEYIFEHSGEGESNIKYLNNLQDSNNLAFAFPFCILHICILEFRFQE